MSTTTNKLDDLMEKCYNYINYDEFNEEELLELVKEAVSFRGLSTVTFTKTESFGTVQKSLASSLYVVVVSGVTD